jgi:hypothetical protein
LPFSSFLKLWSTKSRKSIVFLDIFTTQRINSLKKHCLYKVLALSSSQTIGFISYWIPIQIWCNIFCWQPCLLRRSFLIETLLKNEAIPSPGCLVSSCCLFFVEFLFEYDAISSRGCLVVISFWLPNQIWCNI